MKTFTTRLLLVLGLLLTFAASGRAEESHRGFLEADLVGGGKAVFFVQGNHAILVYVFDLGSNTASFAGGNITDDGNDSLAGLPRQSLAVNQSGQVASYTTPTAERCPRPLMPKGNSPVWARLGMI